MKAINLWRKVGCLNKDVNYELSFKFFQVVYKTWGKNCILPLRILAKRKYYFPYRVLLV